MRRNHESPVIKQVAVETADEPELEAFHEREVILRKDHATHQNIRCEVAERK